MSLSAKMRRAPVRAVTGAFILNTGLTKLKADEDTAKALHGMASGTYGFLGKVEPKLFAKGLAAGEMTLGALVLAPFVSPVVAGLGLAGFSGGLLNMYWHTPSLHEPNDPRPTQQGVPIAKDLWLFGIGAGLIADGLLEPAHDKKLELTATAHGRKAGKQNRRAKKAAKKVRAEARANALEAARGASHELGRKAARAADKADKAARRAGKDAKKAAKDAKKQARKSDLPATARATSDRARKSLGQAVDEYGPVVVDRVSTAAKQAKDAARDAVDEYGPVVADKVSAGAKTARSVARDYADEYGPVVADKVSAGAKTAREAAREAAQDAAERAQQAGLKARDRVAGAGAI